MDTTDMKLAYHKKDNGTTYVYQVLENYWDKTRKQPRNKQTCIGKLDPVTGELIPSKRLGVHGAAAQNTQVTASVLSTGPALLLTKVDESIDLSKTLRRVSPKRWKEILALAWYIVCTSQPLAYADTWCRQHETPSEKPLTSQRVSDLLDEINEDERQSFFKLWGSKIIAQDYLCYDITSVSSYSTQNEYVRWGHNRDLESLPQINLAVVYGQKSGLPVTLRELPGSIVDVSTLLYLLDQFEKLGYPKLHLVMDRGFCSQTNIDALCEKRQHFTLGIPTHLKWVKAQIDLYRDQIDCPDGLKAYEGEQLYAHTVLYPWGASRRRCYLHLYYDPQKQVDDRKKFDAKLLQWRQELEEERRVAENEEYYDTYFKCKRTPKRGLKVTINTEAIQKERNRYAGFQAILSSKYKDAMEVLKIYRDKDGVEKCFDDLKNDLDMKRLRVHSSKRMKSRLFIQFLALILLSQIRKVMRETGLIDRFTTRGLLMELRSLSTIRYSGKYKNKMTEVTKTQREILKAFQVETPD